MPDRKLRQVWVGSQLFQYDANNDIYHDNKQKVKDIRADFDIIIQGRTIEQTVFKPSGPSRVGASDYLLSKAAREIGGVAYIFANNK